MNDSVAITVRDECCICLEERPEAAWRALPCGHVFHDECATIMETYGGAQGHAFLPCPICRRAFDVPPSRVKALPASPVPLRIVVLHQEPQSGHCRCLCILVICALVLMLMVVLVASTSP